MAASPPEHPDIQQYHHPRASSSPLSHIICTESIWPPGNNESRPDDTVLLHVSSKDNRTRYRPHAAPCTIIKDDMPEQPEAGIVTTTRHTTGPAHHRTS